MKVLSAAEMRAVDQRTLVELGITQEQLMETAGRRVVEFLEETFSPFSQNPIVIFCGKGNNGGDGRVVARHLPHAVVVDYDHPAVTAEMRKATIVVDAVLGFGLTEPARGQALDFIREINSGFPKAKVVSIDLPSGMPSDSGMPLGEHVRADFTVTFTALKICQALSPNCDNVGELHVADIGSPPSLYEHVRLEVTEPSNIRALFVPRKADSNKGSYGHVLVVGGAPGKTGAAEMAGLASLRIGAGLTTVACSLPALRTMELMTDSLPQSIEALRKTAKRATVVAMGPGLGRDHDDIVRHAVLECEQPMVLDADALNALAGFPWRSSAIRVVTPHPGEMSRLAGLSVKEVQADRIGVARRFADEHDAITVLKGHRTVIAAPGGSTWINPTGSPAMAKGGTGDILTGLISGLLAQFPDNAELAVVAAVYLHGLCGQFGAEELGDKCLIATELLDFLPEAIVAVSE
jgi:NAD(P)H-hydrate epimerase